MKQYFEKMADIGSELKPFHLAEMEQNAAQILEEEKKAEAAREVVKNAGISADDLHKRGEKTGWERLEMLVDAGTFVPLNSLYDPFGNEEKSTGIFTGIGRISGKYASIVVSDNKVLAGAWIPGQAEKMFRAQDVAERLHIPLVWVLNCSGVKLTQQEEVYPGRRLHGRTFFRHAELMQKGIPIIVGVYGTNPAGGGYHGISPGIIFAHHKANIAVGGAGIVSGMSPKGGFDEAGAEQIVEATRQFKATPPGGVGVHYEQTGFFKKVFETEEGVLNALRECMAGMPMQDPSHFRVAEPKPPRFGAGDMRFIVPHNQKMAYEVEQVIARLVDGSEHMEFRPGYGPDMYCGLAKMDGFLVGVIANRQGFLGRGYPEYAAGKYIGIGGKLYRQGLIKMNEFVTHCGRDRVPIVWVQDTSGIDVGDIAEKAELLGLGQSLIFSIENSDLPMLAVVLRKGTAAAHYVLGGPQATRNNAFTLGTATTEIYVMHGETAAVAAFARRLVKEKDANRPLSPVIDKMNELAKNYHDRSRPAYCAQRGFIDEIVSFDSLRDYTVTFTRCCYQNPKSICPHHQMLLPRVIKG
ncbi:MAG: glutaconyl-CoA decarboxylase subunit alpha [Deltaproteobacteria bacterium]|nr:glutaconyl-CoA decarboxylase subunit alpha [Deltaproteobacteria bacterium]